MQENVKRNRKPFPEWWEEPPPGFQPPLLEQPPSLTPTTVWLSPGQFEELKKLYPFSDAARCMINDRMDTVVALGKEEEERRKQRREERRRRRRTAANAPQKGNVGSPKQYYLDILIAFTAEIFGREGGRPNASCQRKKHGEERDSPFLRVLRFVHNLLPDEYKARRESALGHRAARVIKGYNLCRRRSDVIDGQIVAFRKKFGREPGPHDPIFFDPDVDIPTPRSRSVVDAELRAEMTIDGGQGRHLHRRNQRAESSAGQKDRHKIVPIGARRRRAQNCAG